MAAAAASNGAASSAASGRGAAPAASAASAHDGASALLLRGHRFYVARDIGQARRRELQTLIKVRRKAAQLGLYICIYAPMVWTNCQHERFLIGG
jgi:hypothetical protein